MCNRYIIRLILAGIFFYSIACKQRNPSSELNDGGWQIGAFKSPAVIESAIKERVTGKASFYLNSFLDGQSDGLIVLLGGYHGSEGKNHLQNAVPTPINTLLWETIMNGVANRIAHLTCGQSEDGANMHFLRLATPICQLNNITNVDPMILRQLWLQIIRYDAPQSEMELFVENVMHPTSPFQKLQKVELLINIVQSMLMNPYFLLYR